MKSRLLGLLLVLAVPGALMSSPEKSDDPSTLPTKKILFFSKSSGYEHSVIKDGSKPFKPAPGSEIEGLAFQVLKAIGAKDNIEFVFSKDGSLFTPAYLAQFDAYFFHTTGDLTTVGTDGNPAMTPAGKAAFLQAVADGKGFIGTHCATDTFHSMGSADHSDERYHNDGENADPYIKMIGGEFIIHGSQQESHLIVVDPRFPGIIAVGPDTHFKEEWYSMKNFADNLHVLLVQDTSGMTGEPYARPDYPSTWARMYGKGRVFYTNMGHRDDVWNSALFQSVLSGGISWAVGRVDADVTPNLEQAAPQAGVLPVR
ncbi:MAG TPA: ThuA domain-containing protein, partial [Opitutaceae bacterium]